MSAIRLVIIVLGAFSLKQVFSDTCNDCMSFKLCPSALFWATYKRTFEAEQLFRTSYCGYIFDAEENDEVVKVCCSKFPEPDPIEAHPNRELLPESCGDIDGDKIIGGTVAGLYEFPWMALLSYKTRMGPVFKCGGSVINSKYILTAAHCIVNQTILGVRIGEHNVLSKVDCLGEYPNHRCASVYQDIEIEEILLHEDYQGLPRVINDIALLRLKKTINLTLRNARPICLPITVDLRQVNKSERNSTVAGWGFTQSGFASPILLKVDIPILPLSDCRRIYKRKSTPGDYDKEFCAGVLGKDSCAGDSGGPLMLQEVYNDVLRNVQYGIVSYGPRLCGSTHPAVYTDVTKFMRWILDKLKP